MAVPGAAGSFAGGWGMVPILETAAVAGQFLEVTMREIDKHLFAGERPHSFSELQEVGITRVISLQSGAENEFTDSLYEREDASDFGIKFKQFRWSNVFPPTKSQFWYLCPLLAANSQDKTYVHCHSGVDRTGAAVMFYRIHYQHWPFDMAHSEWVLSGRHWWFAWWKWFLKRRIK